MRVGSCEGGLKPGLQWRHRRTMPHAIIHLHPLPSTNLLIIIITLTFEFTLYVNWYSILRYILVCKCDWANISWRRQSSSKWGPISSIVGNDQETILAKQNLPPWIWKIGLSSGRRQPVFTKNLYLSTSVRVNAKVNVGDVKIKKKCEKWKQP